MTAIGRYTAALRGANLLNDLDWVVRVEDVRTMTAAPETTGTGGTVVVFSVPPGTGTAHLVDAVRDNVKAVKRVPKRTRPLILIRNAELPQALAPHEGGDLADFDVILVNSSGGKDSMAALAVVHAMATAAGVADRIVVQHNDLGRVEWPQTRELAEWQARFYGVRFVGTVKAGLDLLDDIEARGKFPDAARRYCTSDHKRGPGRKTLTALVKELGLGRPARVLQVFGFRAAESSGRKGKAVWEYDRGSSTLTTRHVWNWLPIHALTDVEVWQLIRSAPVSYHPAYRAGMKRLSCSFCVLASGPDLELACSLRGGLARQYVGVEERTGHAFQQGRPLGAVLERVEARGSVAEDFAVRWAACHVCAVPVLVEADDPVPACPMHEGPARPRPVPVQISTPDRQLTLF